MTANPTRIGYAHLADQSANFQRHRWSTAAASRFPAPIQPETGAVPADHGIGSDNCKCIIHLGKQPADAAQYQPVNRPKSKSPGIGTPQHIDLLPQHQNLCLERCARPQQIDHRPKDQFAQIQHRAAASPDSQSTASGLDLRYGQPFRETIGFGHVRQKDFIEHCAIILVLHSWDRRLLPARQTIRTIQSLFQHDFVKLGTPEIRPT